MPHAPYMTHSLYIIKTHTFLPFFLTLIISAGRYNLWSYTLFSFLQFPITFSHNSVRTDQHCSQTQSTDFPQCQRPSVTPTTTKILSKHTNVYTSIASFQKAETKAKHYEAALCNSPNSFPLNFFILKSLLSNVTPKYPRLPNLPKFQTMYQLVHVFVVWYPHCNSTIHNKRRKVACQYTASNVRECSQKHILFGKDAVF